MTKITMSITGERLAAMYDNDMSIFVTPGVEEHPYWSSGPQFVYDYGVASVQEIIDQLSEDAGYDVDIDDLRAGEESKTEYVFEVETARSADEE
jgi:hypothetical protein